MKKAIRGWLLWAAEQLRDEPGVPEVPAGSPLALLVEKVRRVDPSAADYLAEHAGTYLTDKTMRQHVNSIAGAFTWSQTPQGAKFWSDLSEKIH